MGKGCVRFKKLDDLALDVIGETIQSMPAAKLIAQYEKMLQEHQPKVWARVQKLKAGA